MQQASQPTSIAQEWEEVKRSGKNLLEAYLKVGTEEMIGATRRAILAKFALLAFLAVALGLSVYGFLFEATLLAMVQALPVTAIEYSRLGAHGVILVVAAVISLILVKRVKSNVRQTI
jgi:hypothetical protein